MQLLAVFCRVSCNYPWHVDRNDGVTKPYCWRPDYDTFASG